jgi:hypothetical protein
MSKMSHDEMNKVLAGPIALLKYRQTRVAKNVSDHACQVRPPAPCPFAPSSNIH